MSLFSDSSSFRMLTISSYVDVSWFSLLSTPWNNRGGTITYKTVITTTFYGAIGTCTTSVLPQGFRKGAAYEIIVEFRRRRSLVTGHPWNHILLGVIHRWMVGGLLAVLGPLCRFPGGPLIIGRLARFGPGRAARGPRFKHRFGRHFRRTAVVR